LTQNIYAFTAFCTISIPTLNGNSLAVGISIKGSIVHFKSVYVNLPCPVNWL